MLGPEANHHILVSHAENFRWRDGALGDLIPLLGDGLLTIDGDFHRRSRRIMLPAFHHERIAAPRDDDGARRPSARWRPGAPGDRLDLYGWTRRLALRIAMRALFGLDPRRAPTTLDAAHEFEVALGFYGPRLRPAGPARPGTPWARMHARAPSSTR